MASTILRDSSVVQSYKAAVEAVAPPIKTADGSEIRLELNVLDQPETNFNPLKDIFVVVMHSCASVISSPVFKCKCKSALAFQKDTGDIIAAVISDYDPEGENYSYSITFDPNDLKGIDKSKIINYTDFVCPYRNVNYNNIFLTILTKSFGNSITDVDMIKVLTITAFEVLEHWLDVNANPEEVVELYITGITGNCERLNPEEYQKRLKTIAIASVEVVKDIKRKAVEFGEELKAIAKGCSDVNS